MAMFLVECLEGLIRGNSLMSSVRSLLGNLKCQMHSCLFLSLTLVLCRHDQGVQLAP